MKFYFFFFQFFFFHSNETKETQMKTKNKKNVQNKKKKSKYINDFVRSIRWRRNERWFCVPQIYDGARGHHFICLNLDWTCFCCCFIFSYFFLCILLPTLEPFRLIHVFVYSFHSIVWLALDRFQILFHFTNNHYIRYTHGFAFQFDRL